MPLPQNIRTTLFALYEKRKQYKKQMPSLYEKSGEYICLNAGGELFRPDYVTQHFQIILKRNGLKRIRFHDLRHSYATRCFEADIDIKIISEQLGYDNACIESFHSVLKKEEIYLHTYQDSIEARRAIFEYIEFWYNRKRIHSTIDYMTPN